MPIGVLDPGTDEFDLAVNFGSYRYYMFFRTGPTWTRTPLPRTPPPAGTSCHCPSCTSQGWYAQSPVCRFWRAHCEFCRGHRFGLVYYEAGRRPRSEPCEECAEAWREDVDYFRAALRNPRGAARRLREEAAALRHAAQQAERGEQP